MKPIFLLLLAALCILPGLSLAASLDQQEVSKRSDVQSFINEVSAKHGFDKQQLQALFRQVKLKQKIIDAISSPAEAKPWYKYRPIFLTESRIEEGVAFWARHEKDLLRAQQEYGVPPEVIVAILGVETRYGRYKGSYRVMDSLSTLAFAYPKRAKFFRSELEHYLLLTREEGLDPLSLTGSYAGAMGLGQFISSSYRHYAVDFDGDGKRDLWHNTTDAIGSVANYFKRHHWQAGGAVTVPAQVGGNHFKLMVQKGIKPHTSIAQLREQGVSPRARLPMEAMAALIELEKSRYKNEYWLALDNFYVLTRYNHSPLYAMAVYQLGQAISQQRATQDR